MDNYSTAMPVGKYLFIYSKEWMSTWVNGYLCSFFNNGKVFISSNFESNNK